MNGMIVVLFLVMFFLSNILIFESSCGKNKLAKEMSNNERGEVSNITPMPVLETTANPQSEVKWIPSEYQGLKLGRSTYKDVIKTFGKPQSESVNEKFEDDPKFRDKHESETSLKYFGSGVENPSLEIGIGSKTRLVKSIMIHPYSEMKRQDVISKFGSDYFEIAFGESMCVFTSKRGDSPKRVDEYPIALVYPEKGLYVSIRNDNTVMHIEYLYQCVE